MATKQILLPTTVRMEMVKTFKITRSTLDRALKYKGNSARDNMLRKAAFQRGGVIYLGITAPKGYLPDVDTTFENGCMRQKFGHRIEVVVHLEATGRQSTLTGRRSPASTISPFRPGATCSTPCKRSTTDSPIRIRPHCG